MATIPKRRPEPVHTKHGGPPYTRTYPEAASQSFKRGDFVLLSSGKVTICGSDPAAVLGVAAQDASGVTDTPVKVYIADKSTVFVGNLSSAIVSTVALVGVRYGTLLESGIFTVNTADTTGPTVTIIGLDGRDAVGDTNARVHFTFLDSAAQTELAA
jgi:hypothetical protein